MLFQDDNNCYFSWMLVFQALNISKAFMQLVKIFGSYLLLVLSTPKSGSRELLVREVHAGSLASHFGENKTLIMLKSITIGLE